MIKSLQRVYKIILHRQLKAVEDLAEGNQISVIVAIAGRQGLFLSGACNFAATEPLVALL